MKGLVTFARKHLGVELWPGQVEVLNGWADSGKRKALFALGRRSGKGLMAAVAAIKNAAVEDYRDLLRPGEARFVVCVATKEQQAGEFIRTVRELLQAAPDRDLQALVDPEGSTQDEVGFKTGAIIRAMPCSSRSTRGLPISLLVLDELAHFITSEDGFQAGKQVYRALAPSTAQFHDKGYTLITSSTLWQSGIFWELAQAGLTGSAPDLYAVRRPTWEMNPRITRESLDFEFRSDPDSARVEYGAEWLEGGGAFLDSDAIWSAVVKDRKMLPPMMPLQTYRYVGAMDPAFAKGGDSFTFAVGHNVGFGDEARIVIDRLEAWRGKASPLNSDTVLDEVVEQARLYGLQSLTTDQFAVVPIMDGLRRRGLGVQGLNPGTYDGLSFGTRGLSQTRLNAQPLTNESKADIFATLKRFLNLGRLELLDDPALVAELQALEIRPTQTGKPRIQAAAGGRDDRAMAVATVVHQLSAAAYTPTNLDFMDAGRVRSGHYDPSTSFGPTPGFPGHGESDYVRRVF